MKHQIKNTFGRRLIHLSIPLRGRERGAGGGNAPSTLHIRFKCQNVNVIKGLASWLAGWLAGWLDNSSLPIREYSLSIHPFVYPLSCHLDKQAISWPLGSQSTLKYNEIEMKGSLQNHKGLISTVIRRSLTLCRECTRPLWRALRDKDLTYQEPVEF